jgi:hypothetical protein
MSDLPDDLKGDATLSRYADIPALAKAHTEQHRVIKDLQGSKLVLPAADGPAEDWGKVWDALGRPADFNDYDVKMPELAADAPDEARAALAEQAKPFKELAHRIGLTPAQATEVSQWELDRQAALRTKGAEEVAAIKTKLGADYEPKREAAFAAAKQIFGDDADTLAILNEFDAKLGSGRMVMGMLRLGEIAGEAKIIDTDEVNGLGTVQNAEAKLADLRNDATWREKRMNGDAQALRQEKDLLALATRQAQRGR